MRKLTEADLQRLDYLLACQEDEDVMMVSGLDGYLTGILVCPELIMPAEWMPGIWGEAGPAFDSEAEANEVLGLIMALYNDITDRLDDPETYFPLIEEDTDDTFLWEFWAEGFGRALALRPFAWARFEERPHDDRAAMALERLASVARIAMERVEDPAAHAHPVLDETLMGSAGEMFAACVRDLHHDRIANFASAPQRPRGGKTGRNDPCPCGSGRKYKKCCLQVGQG